MITETIPDQLNRARAQIEEALSTIDDALHALAANEPYLMMARLKAREAIQSLDKRLARQTVGNFHPPEMKWRMNP